ncbi:putative integral membrane protein PTH11 [Rosellinia necatrix]|uniref:Putative integral membrane protein PTH11 n=1 Tax=Rosellinia necatrix TaxID=77044 RepID=A0A1W2TXE7_ROSNE|nr:putative integral membrane protein PTH11 [Rosellinia necatrix]
MSVNDLPDPAAVAAAQAAAAAARAFNIQLWTLYAIGVLVTILRTYARIKAVGIRNLLADDLLAWIAILFYTTQTILGYSVGSVAHGLANNGMTDAERAALSIDDPEYEMRVTGSKIQIAGWSIYSSLMCFLKLSVLVFYIRLTEGLGRRYRLQIWIGFGIVIGSFIASIATILLSCLPLHRNWQVNPNPGNRCQPAISQPIVWTCFAANVTTDIYLILIPLPMLWGTSLKLIKKIASSLVLGAGIFVLVSATLKTVFVTIDPVNGAQLAGEWGTREAFVAVFTTNLPMIFPLIKTWTRPLFGSALWSSHKSSAAHEGTLTIGGGGSRSGKRNPRRSSGVNMFTANMSATSSDEHMVHEIPMQNLKITGKPSTNSYPSNAVYVTNQIEVIHEDASSHSGDLKRQRIHENW